MIARVVSTLLAVFVFSIPIEKSLLLPGVGTVSRLAGLLAFLAAVIAACRNRRTLRPLNLAFAMAAGFVAWSALTWFWSLDPPASAARAATLLQLLAMMWLIWEFCRTADQQRQLLHAYVAGAVLASASSVVRYLQGVETNWRRYAPAGFDPNDFGLTAALAIPLALYLSRHGRGLTPWLDRAAVAVILAGVLLSASRAALITAVVAFLFTALTWRRSDWAQRIADTALFAALIFGVLAFAPASTRQRLATLPGEVTTGTLHNRTTIWKAGLKAFRNAPFAGAGTGAYPDAVRPLIGVPARAGHEYVAHNAFLSVLVETGIVGFFLYALLLGVLAVFVWMMPPVLRALWAATLMVWVTGVMTLTWEHRKPGWLVFSLIMTAWARAWQPDDES